MMRPGHLFVSLIALGSGLACSRGRPAEPPTPVDAAPDARALAIYRTVAESVYVQSTQQRIAIVPATLDTACAVGVCAPLESRWGLDPLWWAAGDSTEAAGARRSLLLAAGRQWDLRAIFPVQPRFIELPVESAAAVLADSRRWPAFREANHGAAGLLRFSPVGFGPSGRTAVVHVQWECGPTCGHGLTAALSANDEGEWKVDDMLLVSSKRQP